MKVIQFTHTDLDGVACSIVAKTFFDDIETYSINNNQVSSVITNVLSSKSESCIVIISDLSYTEDHKEVTDLLKDHTVIIADHHKTATWMKKLSSDTCFLNIEPDSKYCGAELLLRILGAKIKINYNKIYSLTKLKAFLKIVSDWDTWRWSENIIKPIYENLPLYYSNAYSLLGFDRFSNRIIRWLQYSFVENPFSSDTKIINEYNKNQEENIEKVLANHKFKRLIVNNDIYKILYLKDTEFQQSVISLVANKKFPKSEYEYDIILIEEPAGFSLRYGGDIDLASIAETFGGGGHKDSAGFPKDGFDMTNLID